MVTTFIANLKAAIRTNEKVNIGGGIFYKAELEEVLSALSEYKEVGKAVGMPGTGDGFTMAVFEGKNVPVGTAVFVKEHK